MTANGHIMYIWYYIFSRAKGDGTPTLSDGQVGKALRVMRAVCVHLNTYSIGIESERVRWRFPLS